MKKKDIILIIVILIIAMIFFLWNQKKASLGGDWAVVTIAGNEYGSYSLGEDKEILIENKYGYNKLVIKDGEAFIQQADCKDRYCVNMGRIKQNGESLICLPHKVVIEIQAEHKQEKKIEPAFDTIAK